MKTFCRIEPQRMTKAPRALIASPRVRAIRLPWTRTTLARGSDAVAAPIMISV